MITCTHDMNHFELVQILTRLFARLTDTRGNIQLTAMQLLFSFDRGIWDWCELLLANSYELYKGFRLQREKEIRNFLK